MRVCLKISRKESFSSLLKTRPVAKTPRLFLHVLPSDDALAFGIMVPKRFVRRAVDRNALKRIFRQACREQAVYQSGKILVRLVKPTKPVDQQERAQWWKEIGRLFNLQLSV